MRESGLDTCMRSRSQNDEHGGVWYGAPPGITSCAKNTWRYKTIYKTNRVGKVSIRNLAVGRNEGSPRVSITAVRAHGSPPRCYNNDVTICHGQLDLFHTFSVHINLPQLCIPPITAQGIYKVHRCNSEAEKVYSWMSGSN